MRRGEERGGDEKGRRGEEREKKGDGRRMLQVGKMKECRLKSLKHRYRCTYLDPR